MTTQEEVRDYLTKYLTESKQRNPTFSMRALALKIEVPSGNLSSFLKGKRSFSRKTIDRIMRYLNNAGPATTNLTVSTIPTNSSQLHMASMLIKRFEDEMNSILRNGKPDATYELVVKLNPVHQARL